MLVNSVVTQYPVERVEHCSDFGCALNHIICDAMQIADGPMRRLRLNQSNPCFDAIGMTRACDPDLAYATPIMVRSFNIEREEAERTFG